MTIIEPPVRVTRLSSRSRLWGSRQVLDDVHELDGVKRVVVQGDSFSVSTEVEGQRFYTADGLGDGRGIGHSPVG